jgi:hypothetical protein
LSSYKLETHLKGGDLLKKVFVVLLAFFFTVSLLGCSQNNESEKIKKKENSNPGASMMGYVMKKEEGRILITNPEAQDFSSTGGVQEFYDAIWFSDVPIDIELGDKVRVWYDSIRESYPGQSEAKRVEVINNKKPEGANLTEQEALYMALTSLQIDINDIAVVKFIEYDNQADRWNIRMKSVLGDKIYNIQIEDK